MALKKCMECDGTLSSSAATCPHCGAKQPKKTSMFTWVVLGVIGLAIFSAMQAPDKPTKTAAPPDPAKEREFQMVVSNLKTLRAATKNPASFDLVDAKLVDSATLCVVFRSTNSFNAIVTERYTMSRTVSSGSADAWEKHCAGQSGVSYSHAKYAL